MGLDMYAYATKYSPEAAVDFTAEGAVELHYWRKHPNLHGWMERLYRVKGGTQSDFNCVNVQLTKLDMYALQDAIRAGDLPATVGPFFGQSDGTEYEDDLRFVAKALSAIDAGLAVFYTSWW